MTDEKTAAALAARSERAVADVIARYSRHLYTVAAAALRGVGTEQDAEEAAADAFVYLWEHPEKFDPRRGSLKTWLSVVARSRALDRSREILRCRAVSLEEIELADPLGVPEALLAGERRAALNAAVDALAEPDREILLRRYYFGQKPREIAAALGYVDASHISKVFSARVGMRINDYRKTYRRVESICRIETDRRVYALVEYICRSYNEPLSARAVAEKFGCTAAEMNRALMLQVEKNFEEFLNYVRINRAAELLLTTDQTVTYIAMEVGYANVKTFNRNFLRFKVMTPGDFRKKVALQESRL